eukprot:snap_masked-scaffold_39-processed-gene-2.5-mRNA-1 protein AED:1.00 eAED:1.00 QI:0/-1/0/1/-1/1/1/0/441
MDGAKRSEDTKIAQLNEIKEGEDYEIDHIQHANDLFGNDIMMNCLTEKNTVASRVEKSFKDGPKIIRYDRAERDAEVKVRINGGKEMFFALLDSGAFRSVINSRLKRFCTKVVKLRNSVKVAAACGSQYEVHEVGYTKEVKILIDANTYTLPNFYAMILEVENWDDIIIGNDVLRNHCLDPISALRSKMQSTKAEVKVMERSCPLVDWFLEEVASVKKMTAMYEEDVNWFREVEEWKDGRVLKLEKLEVEKDDDDVEYILPPEEEFEQMVRAISWPAKLCSDEPVNLSPEDEEEDFDTDGKIDVGANLDVSREEDKKRIAAKLLTMMSSLDLKVFNNSEVWRTRFTSLFVKYSGSFGDGESPTVLSNLPPIECNIMEGKSVGVLNQHPLGYEQEKFLDRRLKQMLQTGIIRVNNNPTTAMALLVVPKKGPKKYRLVVDFRH